MYPFPFPNGQTQSTGLGQQDECIVLRNEIGVPSKIFIKSERFRELAHIHVGFDHGVTDEYFLSAWSVVKDAASMGKQGDGSAGCDEFGKKIEIGMKGISEHKGMDL